METPAEPINESTDNNLHFFDPLSHPFYKQSTTYTTPSLQHVQHIKPCRWHVVFKQTNDDKREYPTKAATYGISFLFYFTMNSRYSQFYLHDKCYRCTRFGMGRQQSNCHDRHSHTHIKICYLAIISFDLCKETGFFSPLIA